MTRSGALPPRLRGQVRALEESVGFLADPVPATMPTPEAVFAMGGAAHRRRVAWVRYRDGRGRETERTLEPYGLAVHQGRWYLSARDAGSDAVRLFRLDRVLEARELVDRNSRMRSIRRPRRPGALRALMAALHSPQAGAPKQGGPARLVTHLQMGSSLRHPILPTPRGRPRGDPGATGRLERRPTGLRPAPPSTVTVH